MKKVFKLSIFFVVALCACLSGTLLNINSQEAYASTTFTSYSQLVNSYTDFSYDYDLRELPSGYCIRDEYIIFTEQQAQLGLCWDFSGHMAMATTIMKKTGEYYNFSESWISVALTYADKYELLPNYNLITNEDYLNGDGGWFIGFDQIVKKYGVVLESDFEYEDVMNVSLENVDNFYNMYSQYATTTFNNNLIAGKFSKYNNHAKKETIIKSMKSHILNHGGIYVGTRFNNVIQTTYKSKTICYKEPSVSTSSGHAMTIIGWDDNIRITHNGKTYTGAWLVQNSWGNSQDNSCGQEGVMYIFYDDTNYDSYFYGYKYYDYANDEDYYGEDCYYYDAISKSSAVYETKENGTFHTNYSENPATTKQKNVYIDQNDVDITYEYTISANTSITNVDIFRYEEKVTNSFTIRRADNRMQIKADNVPVGEYKMVVEYGKGNIKKFHLNQFFVSDGVIINYVLYQGNSATDVLNNGALQCFNSFSCSEDELIIAVNNAKSDLYMNFTFGTYNSIEKVDFNNSRYVKTNTQMLTFVLNYDISVSSEYQMYFYTENNNVYIKTIKLILLTLADESSKVLTNVIYDTDGGDNSVNSKKVIVDKNNGFILSNPTKEGFAFDGWYTSSGFELESKLALNGTKIEYKNVIIETAPTISDTIYNYFEAFWKQFNTIFLYAKWIKINPVVTFETNGGEFIENRNLSYGDKIEYIETTKIGYDFIGWYLEPSFVNLWDFDNDRVYNDLTLFAYFVLKTPTNIVLSTNYSSVFVGDTITLSLNFEHEIKNDLTISIKWNVNDQEKETTTQNYYVYKFDENGQFYFDAILYYSIDDEINFIKTNRVFVEASYNLKQISISYVNGYKYQINDGDSYLSEYIVSVYKNNTKITNYTTNEKLIQIEGYVDEVGEYYISVIKQYEGQSLTQINSTKINVYRFNIYSHGEINDTRFFVSGISLSKPNDLTSLGLIFDGWVFEDGTDCQFPILINQNINIYAKWHLEDLQIESLENIHTTYNNQEIQIEAKASHILDGEYSYIWKNSNGSVVGYNKVLSLKNVADSGDYYCIVKMSVYECETTKETNVVSIIINKAQTILDVSGVQTNYVYNGQVQTISTGAFVERSDEIPTITYSNNSFKNVPESRKLTVVITAEETDNYNGATIDVIITIDKAQTTLDLSGMVTEYTYNGQEQVIESGARVTRNEELPEIKYTNNTFTNVPESKKLCVTVEAKETDNYYGVINNVWITINKAQTNLDVSGIKKIYTYNGNEQAINSGAVVTRLEELPEIVYTNNTFINVPEGNILTITITALETENYASATINVDITINKLETTLNISKVVTEYTYNGKTQVVDGAYVERELETPDIVYYNNIFKDVPQGNKITVKIEAKETTNYKNDIKYVEITINKANTILDVSRVITNYTYNGKQQVVNSGAVVDRNSELPQIVYTNNKFTSVPVNKTLLVKIEAKETGNYNGDVKELEITINKAKTIIDVSNVITNYTYNGFEQIINSGAKVNRNYEIPQIVYSNNKFLNVPKNKLLLVKIEAKETANFEGEIVEVEVTINKAQTILDVSGIKKSYTYNGLEQTINSGAVVTRHDELPEIEYINNKFTNVPKTKKLTVQITAKETENYKMATTNVDVDIYKAQGKILIENKNQEFVYSKKQVSPILSLNNSEQNIITSMPINVGVYDDYVLIAQESENYLEAAGYVNIKIVPAKITIKVDDKTSLWLFELMELTYTIIEGEVFDGDDLNEQISCNISSSQIGFSEIIMGVYNKNYDITIINGTYVVNALPHILILCGLVAIIVLIIISVTLTNKRRQKLQYSKMGLKNINCDVTKNVNQEKETESKGGRSEIINKSIKELYSIDRNEKLKKPPIKPNIK